MFAINYIIPTDNLPTLTKKMEKLARVAAKLQQPIPHMENVFSHTTDIRELIEGTVDRYRNRVESWHVVTVFGTRLGFSDWSFVASLEHTDAGNIINNIGGEELPEHYRFCASLCEHCTTKRRRNKTYVLRHADGTYRQVGRNCIGVFLGAADPQRLAAWAEALGAFDTWFTPTLDEDGNPIGGTRERACWSLSTVLATSAAVINSEGWVSKTMAAERMEMPTATQVLDYMEGHPINDWVRALQERVGAVTTDHMQEANAAIQWAMATTDTNEYAHKLRVIATTGLVTMDTLGLAVSIMPVYRRAMQPKIEKATVDHYAMSEFVALEKERITFTAEVLAMIDMPPTDWGRSTLVKLGARGNVFTWFSSGQIAENIIVGKHVHCVGTVKAHRVYENVKQTILTRCKLTAL